MKKFLSLLFILGAAGAFTACDDNNKLPDPAEPYENPATASQWFYRGDIKVVQTDGSVYTDEDIVVKVAFDTERDICNMVIYNVSFAENMPLRIDMLIGGIAVSETSSGYKLTGNGIVPTYKGEEFPYYTVNNLSVDLNSRAFNMTMDCGSYPVSLTAVGYKPSEKEYDDQGDKFDPTPEPITPPSDATYEGLFTIEGRTGPAEDPLQVGLTVDQYGICKIVLYDATFTPGLPEGAGMPRMDIEIDGVRCGVGDDGTYILTGDGIVPVAKGLEFPEYTVSDLAGVISGDEFRFTMVCGTTPAAFEGVKTVTEE